MKVRILDSGCKAQDKGDSRNHGFVASVSLYTMSCRPHTIYYKVCILNTRLGSLCDPSVYVLFWGPRNTRKMRRSADCSPGDAKRAAINSGSFGPTEEAK